MDEEKAAELIAAYAKQLERNDLMIRMAAIVGITVMGVSLLSYVKAEIKK